MLQCSVIYVLHTQYYWHVKMSAILIIAYPSIMTLAIYHIGQKFGKNVKINLVKYAKFYKCFMLKIPACAINVGFSKIGSAGSDSNCKQLLVYCMSVVNVSPKMFNSELSWHQQASSSRLLTTHYSLLYSKQSRHIEHSSFFTDRVVSTAYTCSLLGRVIILLKENLWTSATLHLSGTVLSVF